MTATLTIPRPSLARALQLAAHVSPNRTTRDVLRFGKLTVTQDAVWLEASDMEAHVRLRLDTPDAVDEHASLWPIAPLVGFLRDTAGDEAALDLGGRTISADGDTMHFAEAGDPDEFPAWRAATGSWARLPASSIQQLASRTVFAAASDAGRYAMHGILLVADAEAGTLTAVATDGRRMSLANTTAHVSGEGWRAIVPAPRLATIAKLATEPDADVTLTATPDQGVLSASTEGAALSLRLVDGEFPRYESVIPQGDMPWFEADAEALARKVRVVSAALGEEARAVRVTVEDGMLRIAARCSTADARAELAVEAATAMETAFSPDYVLPALKGAEGVIRLTWEKATTPVRLTLAEDWTYVVMPITLEG